MNATRNNNRTISNFKRLRAASCSLLSPPITSDPRPGDPAPVFRARAVFSRRPRPGRRYTRMGMIATYAAPSRKIAGLATMYRPSCGL